VKSGLNDSVFLSVRANTLTEIGSGGRLTGAPCAPTLKAVLDPAWCPVVPGRDDSAILDNNRSYLSAQTITALLNDMRDVHEVGVPVRAFLLCCHA